ncbi:MAG: VOC family protein [Cyclobacteriaceae bacterium]|nr:VOC family protein [Cyclobacteriaceae bacterium]
MQPKTKRMIVVAGIVVSILCACMMRSNGQTKPTQPMKLNAGIATAKLAESKDFYTRVLGFGVSFENDFYLLLHTPDGRAQISFLLPNHASQQPVFKPAYGGQGMYLTIEVEDVDAMFARLKALGTPLAFDVRTERWGDRHFGLVDPNGIAIDIVTYTPPDHH